MSSSYSAYQVAQAYRSASIAVSPLTGVIMLLDGAILFLKRSIEASKMMRIEDSHNHMLRTTAILRGLQHHLNVDKGGAVAGRLSHTYNSLIIACLTSFGAPDAERRYRRIIGSLTELRDAWSAVAAVAKAEERTAPRVVVPRRGIRT